MELFALLVVPIHHQGLVGGVHRIVVDVLAKLLPGHPQTALQVGIAFQKGIVIAKGHVEHIFRLLNVADAALPVKIQKIHPGDGNVPQATQLVPIPEHAVDAGAGNELTVPDPVVDLLEIAVIQNHRQHRRKHLGLGLVGSLPGQHIDAGEIIHCIGVLACNGAPKPTGDRFHLRGGLAHTLPVAQLVPLLVFHHPLFQIGLPRPVALEGLPGSGDLFLPDGQLLFFVFLHCNLLLLTPIFLCKLHPDRESALIFRRSGEFPNIF